MRQTMRFILTAAILVTTVMQIGCGEWTAEDKAFVKDLAQEWLRSKNMSPTDQEGKVDFMGSLRFAQAAVGRSDDEEANAVLGIYTSVSGVIAADKAMDEARANGDAAKMDEVIASRPDDWTYRSSRATLALAKGDISTYEVQADASAFLSEAQGVPASRYARQVIKDYQTIAVPDKGEQGYRKHTDLCTAYSTLYDDTGDESYLVAASAEAMAAEAARD